jgi:hypothetical protein
MTLKPHTWYWFWAHPEKGEDGRYIEGVTELHEIPPMPPNKSYCAHVRTDADGKIIEFKQVGEFFPLPEGWWTE